MKKRIIFGLTLIVVILLIDLFSFLYNQYVDNLQLYPLAVFSASVCFFFGFLISIIVMFEYLNLNKYGSQSILIYILAFLSMLYLLLAPFFPNFTIDNYLNKNNAILFQPTDLLVVIFFWTIVALFLRSVSLKLFIFIIFGLIFISFCLRSFIFIALKKQLGWSVIFYLFSISVANDSFAYFGGKLFGKRKFIKDISPNKTLEGSIIGCICGIFFGTLFACLFAFLLNDNNLALGNSKFSLELKVSFWYYFLFFIFVSFVIGIVSQIGDLVFSLLKRTYNVKDFSNIMKSHGGVLDRIDSSIFVCGFFCILYVFVNHG